MSATPKIPDSMIHPIIARYHDGWSLRRIATWLTEEQQLPVSRTAVSNALIRGGEAEPECLDDTWSELVEEAQSNLSQLSEVQAEIRKVIAGLHDKSIAREDAAIIAKLLTQQERILLWKLRTAGLRAPPVGSIHSFLPTVRSGTVPAPPPKPVRPPPSPERAATLPPKPPERPVTTPPKMSEPDAGRNAPCPCGSGVKYKKCHGGPSPAASVTHAVTNGASRMTALTT